MVGFWPANSVGDDIELYTDESRTRKLATLHTLRQQIGKREGDRANVAPRRFRRAEGDRRRRLDRRLRGHRRHRRGRAIAERFKRANDDYSAIMVKALADRLAEAFAERLHEQGAPASSGAMRPTRRSRNERADRREVPRHPPRARAIRRSPTTPRRRTLFKLLDAEAATGLKLTESFAMWPAAAVSGLYFSHPKATISASARSSATRSRTTPAQGLERDRGRALAGARSSTTIRSGSPMRLNDGLESGCARSSRG